MVPIKKLISSLESSILKPVLLNRTPIKGSYLTPSKRLLERKQQPAVLIKQVLTPQTPPVFKKISSRMHYQPKQKLPVLVFDSSLIFYFKRSRLFIDQGSLLAFRSLNRFYNIVVFAEVRSEQRAKFALKIFADEI